MPNPSTLPVLFGVTFRTLFASALMLDGLGCMAQLDRPDPPSDWGPGVEGVQLSISVNTNVVSVGSGVRLKARIRNSTTNVVSIGVGDAGVEDFKVRLVDSAGNEHNPVPRWGARDAISNRFLNIKAGSTFETEIPILSLDPGLGRGSYRVRASHSFLIRATGGDKTSGSYQLESNQPEIEVR